MQVSPRISGEKPGHLRFPSFFPSLLARDRRQRRHKARYPMYRYLPTVFLLPHVRLRNSRLDASVVIMLSMTLAHKWFGGSLLGRGAPGWALSKLSFDCLPTSSQYSLTKMIDSMSESLATHRRVIREQLRHPGVLRRSIS